MENIAKVHGKDLPISKKHAVEICDFIRGKGVQRSKELLQQVLDMRLALPFRRFNKDVGHRKGKIAAGRYPRKASEMVIGLLESLEANAQNKGMDAKSLYVKTIIANKAHTPWHFGRLRRRKMKRAHIEIIAMEKTQKQAESKENPIK